MTFLGLCLITLGVTSITGTLVLGARARSLPLPWLFVSAIAVAGGLAILGVGL